MCMPIFIAGLRFCYKIVHIAIVPLANCAHFLCNQDIHACTMGCKRCFTHNFVLSGNANRDIVLELPKQYSLYKCKKKKKNK